MVSYLAVMSRIVNTDSYFFPHTRLLKISKYLLWCAKNEKARQDELQEKDKKGLLPPQIGTFVDDVIRCPIDEFLVPSFLLLVFSFEAFINTIGEFVIDDFIEEFDSKYDKQKRKSTRDKAKAIYEKLGLPYECGEYPLQLIFESFKNRNEWVHAKAVENKKEYEYENETEASRAFWEGHKVNCERVITFEYVEQLHKCIDLVIEQIKNRITPDKLSDKHKEDLCYIILDGEKSASMR